MKKLFALCLLIPVLLWSQITTATWRTFTFLTIQDSLKQNPVRAITTDVANNLWVALASGYASPETDSTFTIILTADSSIAPNTRNDVRDLAWSPVNSATWLATGAGLSLGTIRLLNTDSGLVSNNVWRVMPDTLGNVYFGTYGTGAGLYFFDPDTLVFNNFTDSLPGTTVFSMARDSSGNLWFGTDSGATVYMGPGAWFNYTTADGLPSNRVYAIAVDDSNDVWFGGPQGAVRFDQDTLWTDISDSLDAYGGRTVYDISCSKWKSNGSHLTFFATDSGVVSYRLPTGYCAAFTSESTNDSLPNNFIHAIYVERHTSGLDSLMTIWIGTPAGLTRERKQ